MNVLMLVTQGREGCEAVPVPGLMGRQNIFRAPRGGWASGGELQSLTAVASGEPGHQGREHTGFQGILRHVALGLGLGTVVAV